MCCIATAEHDVDQTKSITSPVRGPVRKLFQNGQKESGRMTTQLDTADELTFHEVTRAYPIRQQLRMVARGQVTNLWPLRPFH